MDPLKIYFLFKMGVFHCYVSLPEGIGKMSTIRSFNVGWLAELKTLDIEVPSKVA